MGDRLQELSAFVRAAETGSFSHVAREFRVSQPSVSRMVASLETRLGIKLLLRTTRRVTPTDAGAAFLERARQILGDLGDAENAARGLDSLQGTLRVAMSGAFGTREVVPHLPAFLEQHPQLRLDLFISDRTDDLVAEGVDMALRLGRLSDSVFGARLLASAPRLVIAAPSYLAKRGTPKMLADLASHDCIVGPGLSGQSERCDLDRGGGAGASGNSRRRNCLREGRSRNRRRFALDV
jgi:DNA-binding transcriptional LysR family regulator